MEEFVFGTKEAVPTSPFLVSPSAPAAFQAAEISPTPSIPFALLPIATPSKPFVSAPDPVSIQSKEPSLMSKLQAPDKEATVRVAVDMSVGRARFRNIKVIGI